MPSAIGIRSGGGQSRLWHRVALAQRGNGCGRGGIFFEKKDLLLLVAFSKWLRERWNGEGRSMERIGFGGLEGAWIRVRAAFF